MTSFDANRGSRVPLALAIGLVAVVCLLQMRQMSLGIDGTRYYYLDDDQMISMRYARNLAEGQGLVWNAGERVEGYTNFGWVLVMAAVHRLGTPDRLTSLGVKAIACVLAMLVLLLTNRLLTRLAPNHPWWIAATCLTTLALSYDLLFWTVNGFETPLLTAVFLVALLRALDDAERGTIGGGTCLLAGLLPLVRSDAADLTAIVLIVGVWLGARRRLGMVVLAAVPLALHLAFRVSYYGDWLPNTYYLKVAGRSGLALGALGYMKGFVAAYPALIVLGAWALATGGRVPRVLLASMTVVGVMLLLKGADMFEHHRFIAPLLPVMLAAVCASLARMPAQSGGPVLASVLLVSTLFTGGVNGGGTLRGLESPNGLPRVNTVTGVLINRYTAHDATILVAAAGAVGYFSHRTAVDMLGKTDREIAHLPPRLDGPTGHNHFDPDRSLAHRPDLVVTFGSRLVAENAPLVQQMVGGDVESYGFALLANPTFVARYRPYPVPVPFLDAHNAIFVREDSVERASIGVWREPRLTP